MTLTLIPIYAWKRFYNDRGASRFLSFTIFDATRMPIKNNCFDIVISSGGIGNIPFNYLVLKEAYRVLRPGGRLIFADGVIVEEDFEKLPDDIKAKWLNTFPFLTKGYKELLANLGYNIALYRTKGIHELNPNEGDLPREAYKHKITLRYRGIFVKAVKP